MNINRLKTLAGFGKSHGADDEADYDQFADTEQELLKIGQLIDSLPGEIEDLISNMEDDAEATEECNKMIAKLERAIQELKNYMSGPGQRQ